MKSVYSLCAVALLAGLLVMGASAATVTVDKHDYKSGETITTHVTGMVPGVYYSMKYTADQYMKPGMPSAFESANITWPFSLTQDKFRIMYVNTTQNSVIIGDYEPAEEQAAEGGAYHELTYNGTSVNGVFTREHQFDNNETGTFTSKWIATPAPGATIVSSIFWINGSKMTGPESFTVNTSATTLNPAVVRVEIFENNTLVSADRYTLDAAAVPTNIPTLPPSGGSGGESYSGSGSVIATATQTTSSGSGSGSGSANVTKTPVGPSGTVTGVATPVVTPTVSEAGNASAATTTTTAGSPFAFVALGALGCAALLFAGRLRR